VLVARQGQQASRRECVRIRRNAAAGGQQAVRHSARGVPADDRGAAAQGHPRLDTRRAPVHREDGAGLSRLHRVRPAHAARRMDGARGMSRVFPLQDNQAKAVDPADSVWLSASAGTGKTQVLSARVLRLLLAPGVRPENILCLTFTKAGAAEMATRVSAVLAGWVRMAPEALAADVIAIGAEPAPESQARARTLFASVLDCPGGGLRFDTIHAFAQWLLAAFPEEAGLIPGTRPMEDRDREVLAHEVLADLLAH